MTSLLSLVRSHVAIAVVLACAFATAGARAAPDGKVKSWLTAEMFGAMQWAREEAGSSKERLEFATAARICRERLNKQIDDGAIARSSALLIAETTRRDGKYRGEPLTLKKAHEIRRSIISGKIFEELRD